MRGLMVAVVCCLSTALMAGGWGVQARARTPLTFAVEAAGTDSFVFATELWAVSEVALPSKARFDLEVIQVPSGDDRLHLLLDDQVAFAFIRGPVSTAFADRIRAVMAPLAERCCPGRRRPDATARSPADFRPDSLSGCEDNFRTGLEVARRPGNDGGGHAERCAFGA